MTFSLDPDKYLEIDKKLLTSILEKKPELIPPAKDIEALGSLPASISATPFTKNKL